MPDQPPVPRADATSESHPEGHLETASWGRRVLALVIDWAACQAVVYAVVGTRTTHGADFYPLALFWLESAIGTALLGASFGQLLARIRVRRLDGRPLELLPALLRSLLICLVIPPLVFKPDGRGLHDMAVGSATVPLVPAA